MTTKHTPLKIDERRDGMASISKSDGECITGWLNEHHAEEIVRAVNSYDDLVAALELCYQHVNGGGNLRSGLHHEAYTAARAALAKAKGE